MMKAIEVKLNHIKNNNMKKLLKKWFPIFFKYKPDINLNNVITCSEMNSEKYYSMGETYSHIPHLEGRYSCSYNNPNVSQSHKE